MLFGLFGASANAATTIDFNDGTTGNEIGTFYTNGTSVQILTERRERISKS